MSSPSARCAHCSWPSAPPPCPRTMCTGDRRSCSCPGTSASAGLAGDSVRVIGGPTAAGKSAIALALAARHGAVIIGADSRQIYRGFDIGTAKPTAAERAAVEHRGIDIAAPTERYAASRWSEEATRAIEDARTRGLQPLVVGGSGFYLRALFTPLFEEPALDPRRRSGLQRFLEDHSLDELRRWCRALDPDLAHLGRTQLLR